MNRFLDQRLSLRQLRAIEAIDRCGSISKAAIELGITQPALSKSLHEAEEVLRLKIFDRSPRGVVRQPYGDGPIIAARNILLILRKLEDELERNVIGASDTVTMGSLPATGPGLLPLVIPPMMKRFPRIQINIVDGMINDLLIKLASGDIDMIVGRIYENAEIDRFIVEKLYNEPLALIARSQHPLFDPKSQSTHWDYETILPTYAQRYGPEAAAFCHEVGLRPCTILKSASVGFLCEFLCSSDMLSVLPPMLVAGHLRRGTLKIVPTTTRQSRAGGIIWPADRTINLGARAMADFVRRGIEELIAEGSVIGRYSALDLPAAVRSVRCSGDAGPVASVMT